MRYVFIFLFFALAGKAQTPYTQQIQYPYQLPTKVIYDMMIDRQGLLYLGTDKGLFRFNGKQATLIPSPDARQTDITYLQEDNMGRLWGMNFARQIFYVERDTLQVFPLKSQDITGTIVNFVHTKNQMWVLSNHSLISYDIKTFRKIFDYTVLGKDFTQIVSFNNAVYVATNHQFMIFQETHTFTTESAPTGFEVSFGTYKGALHAIQRREVKPPLKHVSLKWQAGKQIRLPDMDLPTSVFVYQQVVTKQQMWLCTRQGGYMLEPETGKTRLIFPDKNFTDIVQDYQGNFWISTLDEGLWFCPSLQNMVYDLPTQPQQKTALSSVYLFENELYFGTNDGQVLKTTLPKGTWQTVCKASHSEIRRIAFDAQSRQFVAGMGIFDLKGNKKGNIALMKDACFGSYKVPLSNGEEDTKRLPIMFLSHPYGFHLHLLHETNIQTIGSFTKIKDASAQSNQTVLGSNTTKRSYSIIAHPNKPLFWVGYDDGLVQYSFVGKPKNLETPEKKPIIAHSLAIDEQGRLWIGTFQQGLFVWEGAKLIAHFQAGKALKNNHVYKLVAGKDKMWLGTEAEIGYVDLKSLQYTDVLVKSGLSSSFAYKDFYPDEVGIWIAMSQSVMYLSNFAQSVEEELRLLPIQILENQIFRAEALHYKNPSKVEIKYRLKGIDNEWRTIQDAHAIIRLNHLRKGDYVLEIYAQDAITKLKSPIRIHQFTVPSLWWETWYFFSALFLIIAGVLWSLAYFIIERNRKKHLFKEQLWISQIKALQSQMNPHFLYNIMNTVQGLVYSNRRGAASELLRNFSDLMRNTLQMSEKPYISLKEEIELLQLYIKLEKMRFEDEIQCDIVLHFNIADWEQPVPSMLLQPFVENAFKHGLLHKVGEKKLLIEFAKQEHTLQVSIEDNGIGRKHAQEIQQRQARKSTGFALGATQQRMDLLNKLSQNQITLEILDKYNEKNEPIGTKVIIQIQFKP